TTHFILSLRRVTRSTLFPYTTLFRSLGTTPSMAPIWHVSLRSRKNVRSSQTGLPVTSLKKPPTCSIHPRSEYCLQNANAHWRAKDRKKHTSELQSRSDLVCRLLLEKK